MDGREKTERDRIGQLGVAPSRRAVVAGLLLAPTFAGRAFAGDYVATAEAARGLAPRGLNILVPQGSDANVRPIAKMFEQHSGISVKIETADIREIGTKIMLQKMTADSRWDIALPAIFDLPDLIAAQAISPISPQFVPDDLPRPIYQHGDIFDGVRYGFQTDGDQQMLFYNADIYDNDSIAKPYEDATSRAFTLPQSWSEFDAQIIHVGSVDGYRGALLSRQHGHVEMEFWLRLLAKGVWPLDPDFTPQIQGDAGVEALQEMIAVAPYLAESVTGPSALVRNKEMFEQGRILAYSSYGGLQKMLNSPGAPLAGRILHGAPPGGDGPDTPESLPSFTWGWSYVIPRSTENQRAASHFAAFAVSSTPSTEAIRVPQGFFDPFLPEHYEDDAIKSVYGEDFLSVHYDAMTNSMPDFYVPQRGAYMSSLARWLSMALDLNLSPADALSGAAGEWNLISQTLDIEKQRDRWRSLRDAFPASIASRLSDLGDTTIWPDRANEG